MSVRNQRGLSLVCRLPLRVILFVISSLAASAPPACAGEIRFIGRTMMAPDALDLSQQTEAQENGTPQNRLGALGSGIAWEGRGHRYVMLPDRGPEDGAVSYRCRFQEVEILVDPGSPTPVVSRLLKTVFLTSSDDKNFVGKASQFDVDHPERSLRMDPEGIRVTNRGTLLISEEYGPTVMEFDLKGKWIRSLPTPNHYKIASPGATPQEELPPHNASGRQNNRGWEGVAIGTNGNKVYAIAQSPLIQDGGLDEKNSRVGTNVRIWESDLKSGVSREFLYPLENGSLGCSDIEAIAPNRLLVIERDGKAGTTAEIKHLYEIDLSQATDISSIERLPAQGIPDGIRPVSKKLFIDLLSSEYGLADQAFPEKIEGITFGPKLDDGARVLIVTSDNDFKPDQPTFIYAFAVK